jgi:8-oxo-dGTP pyrophosphatase MutT (NUDIX family)
MTREARALPSRQLRAAGGVVWRSAPDGSCQVALVHRPRYDDWSLPKGKPEGGEHPVMTAVREVWEETGQRVVLGRPLGATSYPITLGGGSARKRVVWFAMEAVDDGPVTGSDVDVVRWMPAELASEALTQDRDRAVLTRFLSGPAAPALAVLVRAADAGPAVPQDDRRPLSPEGRQQAEELALVLAPFCPVRVVAAPALRCRQTVTPLALRLGLRVEVDQDLGEVRGRSDLTWAGAAARPSAVICPQETRPRPGDTEGAQACAWVLAFDGDRLAAADPLPAWTGADR